MNRRASINIFFAAYYAAGGVLLPFLSLFLERNGLRPSAIGVLLAVHSLSALSLAPVWGAVSDGVVSPVRLIRSAIAALAALGIVLALPVPMWLVVVVTTLIAAVDAGLQPLSDRLAVMVEREERGATYGSIRVFGSLGWICVTPLAGMFADRFDIRVLFVGYTLLLIPAFLTVRSAAASRSAPRSHRFGRDTLLVVLDDVELRLLVAALVVHQFVSRSIFRFEPLYLDRFGVRMAMIGFASAIPAIVELAAMPVASHLGRRFSPRRVIVAGMVAFLVRMVLVRLYPVAPVVIASKVLGGVQFAFVLVGTVGMLTERWVTGPIGTALAVITVSVPHVVQLVAFPVSGYLFERLGGAFLYTLGAAGSVVSIVLVIVSGRHGAHHTA